MSLVSLTKAAFKLLQDRFTDLGYEKRKPGIFSSVISDDVIGWLGLNIAGRGRSDALEINPVVGIRNQTVERLVSELTGDAFDELIPPTIAGNVGYLSPERRYWSFTFSGSTSNEEAADQLCASVKKFGLPFMTKAADLQALAEMMETLRFGMADQLRYRLPVALWLLGNTAQAEAFIGLRLSEIGTRNDPAALRYITFAKNLKGRMERQLGLGEVDQC